MAKLSSSGEDGASSLLAHAALLVIDMQEHFRPMAERIVPELVPTIRAFRDRHLPVIFTQHGHRRVALDSGQLGQFWGHDQMIEYGGAQWQLLPELDVREVDGDYRIDEKRRYDAFHGTLLEQLLRQMKVDTVVIAGVMTNLCCETTARSAFCRDFRVLFLADGTATSDERLHECTLQNIAYGFGRVLKCRQLRAELSGEEKVDE